MDLMKEAYRGGIDRILTYLPKGWFAGDLVSEIFDEGWDLWEKANLKDGVVIVDRSDSDCLMRTQTLSEPNLTG